VEIAVWLPQGSERSESVLQAQTVVVGAIQAQTGQVHEGTLGQVVLGSSRMLVFFLMFKPAAFCSLVSRPISAVNENALIKNEPPTVRPLRLA